MTYAFDAGVQTHREDTDCVCVIDFCLCFVQRESKNLERSDFIFCGSEGFKQLWRQQSDVDHNSKRKQTGIFPKLVP